MGKPKSLVLPMAVDVAQRRHSCQHNSNHVIFKGDLRLKVAMGRTADHYCIECAKKFIKHGIDRLQQLHSTLVAQVRNDVQTVNDGES